MEISHAVLKVEQHTNLWGEDKYKLRQTHMHMNKIKVDVFYSMKAVLAYHSSVSGTVCWITSIINTNDASYYYVLLLQSYVFL